MAPTPDEAARRRDEAAQRYQPERVRLLLIAHAPPKALDRYFYFEDVATKDDLFRYVIRGLFGSFPDRSDKPRWLEQLRSSGVFLIDLMPHPYDGSDLGLHVVCLADRVRALEPDHVILIKADVFDAAFTHLQGEGLPVVDQRISFPGSGRQREFEASFATALEKIAWVMLQPAIGGTRRSDTERFRGAASARRTRERTTRPGRGENGLHGTHTR